MKKFTFLPYLVPVQYYSSSRILALKYSAIKTFEGFDDPFLWQGENYYAKADCYVMGKGIRKEFVANLTNEKEAGAKFVLDLVDPAFPYPIRLALELADVITTSTEQQAEIYHNNFKDKKVIVIPDALDYGIVTPWAPPKNPGVVWFGNGLSENFSPSRVALNEAKKAGEAVTVITDLKLFKDRSFNCVPWDYHKFLNNLRNSDVCISFQPEGSYKSDNKAVVAIGAGLPVITNGGTNTAKLLEEHGLEEFIWKPGRSVPELVRLARENKKDYLGKIQEKIIQERNYLTIGNVFLYKLNEYFDNRIN